MTGVLRDRWLGEHIFGSPKDPMVSQVQIQVRKRETYSFEGLLYRHFLRTDKAPDSHLDSQVNIIGPHIFSQMHLGAGFSHTNHGFEMSHSDGERTGSERFASQISIETG